MIVASASGKGWGGGWQSMNGTKGEGRASEKVEQTWQMDEREKEREALQKVVKMWKRGGTPFHFLLADGEKLSSIVTSLAIVGTRYRYSHPSGSYNRRSSCCDTSCSILALAIR